MKEEKFIKIIEEFKQNYLNTGQGKKHLETYNKEREEVKRVFNDIKDKRERGEDITNDVLYKLLPYQINEPNKERGYRTSIWGFTTKDIKSWYENAGWQKPNNWKNVASALFDLVQSLIENEDEDFHRSAINNFVESEYSKGFQTGFITPILYPLKNSFLVINEKTVDTVGFISKEFMPQEIRLSTKLKEYIDNNAKLKGFLEELAKKTPEFKNFDVFDMFCHWMCDKNLGGYARRDDTYEEEIKLSQTTEDPKVLEELYKQQSITDIDLEDPRVREIFESLQNYKQVILYGPPGTSKTYYAKVLAFYITNDQSRIEFVQFHPSYSYEDFIEGIFPEVDEETGQISFKIKDKIFKRLCKEAETNPDKNYVLIIDEINRADLSKVFGEIFSALEYRKEVVKLLYSEERFTIPTNLYIIGTMNTLDKSTVDIDFALMRRFKFFEVGPDKEILRKMLKKNGVENYLIEQIIDVFEKIQPKQEEEGYPLGHAYFKDIKSKQDLKLLWEHQLSFLLKEYFADLKKDVYERIKEIYWEGLKLED